MIRVALAGAGWVSAHHLDAWRQLTDRAAVVAIADPNLAAARRRAAEFGIPAVHESAEELLARREIDAIDVATPRETHALICRLAAARGLAILCQKPLAPTLADAEALVAGIGSGARLMVHENWRFRPHYRRIHAWLRDGRIGLVRTVAMSVLTSGLLPDRTGALPALARQPMLMTLDRMLLMEVLIHHVDTLRFLLGPLALGAARLGKHCPALAGEDRAALFLTTAGGAAVSLVGDFMAHGHPPQAFDRLEILGTEGAIALDRDRLVLRGHESEDIAVDLAADYAQSYLAAITHFLDRLADGAPFETAPEDNLETLRIVEQAYGIGGWTAPPTQRA
jgi:predicted dehydrogenase